MQPGGATACSRIFLGTDSRQALRIGQTLLAIGVYAIFAALQQIGVASGWLSQEKAAVLDAFNLGGAVVFYALIRSGVNLRLGLHPALTIPQMSWALLCIAAAYHSAGPGRSAALVLLVLVVLFGVFSLKRAAAIGFACTALALLGAVMAHQARMQPSVYPPPVEILQWLATSVVMAAATLVSIRLGELRASLVRQRGELAAALERLRILATHDELTGLVNRRAAADWLQSELTLRDRPQRTLTLALIDIDHFKRINDLHGHIAGDLVLKRFAGHGMAELRNGESLARWGGEEFLLLISGDSSDGARRFLKRLRDRMQGDRFDEVPGGLQVTFSAGLSQCGSQADIDSAIARADQAMYDAKRQGRDRVVGP